MKTHNGWTNYDTWAANLWLTNDEVTYYSAQHAADLYEDDLSMFADECTRLLWDLGPFPGFPDEIDPTVVDWGEIHNALVEE